MASIQKHSEQRAKAIIAVIASHGRPVSAKELFEHAAMKGLRGKSFEGLSAKLLTMVKRKQLVRPSLGVFVPAEPVAKKEASLVIHAVFLEYSISKKTLELVVPGQRFPFMLTA